MIFRFQTWKPQRWNETLAEIKKHVARYGDFHKVPTTKFRQLKKALTDAWNKGTLNPEWKNDLLALDIDLGKTSLQNGGGSGSGISKPAQSSETMKTTEKLLVKQTMAVSPNMLIDMAKGANIVRHGYGDGTATSCSAVVKPADKYQHNKLLLKTCLMSRNNISIHISKGASLVLYGGCSSSVASACARPSCPLFCCDGACAVLKPFESVMNKQKHNKKTNNKSNVSILMAKGASLVLYCCAAACGGPLPRG